jgi:hypothetical protein
LNFGWATVKKQKSNDFQKHLFVPSANFSFLFLTFAFFFYNYFQKKAKTLITTKRYSAFVSTDWKCVNGLEFAKLFSLFLS